MDRSEVEALIKLLDDPDELVFGAIRTKIQKIGLEVVPLLEQAWEKTLDGLLQQRVETIIHDIQFKDTLQQFDAWINSEDHDLITGAVLVAKVQFADFDFSSLEKKVEVIKREVWLELNDSLTALEKVKVLNHVFFDLHGFTRSNNFQRSSNAFFINQAIETKKGAPILLAIIYAGIAQRLGIPIYGVALARNFILGYRDTHQDAFSEQLEHGLLFYVNPFNKGIVFGKEEITKFIEQQKLEKKTTYFQSCSNLETIKELVKALVGFFQMNGQSEKEESYSILLKKLYF